MGAKTVAEVKQLLTANGLMVYRAVGDCVALAERVRDNLIMEAHVSVRIGSPLSVRFSTRALRSDFPSSSETESTLLERAREVGLPALSSGFVEVGTHIEPVPDPMDGDQHLDVWYQVIFERPVDTDESLLSTVIEAIQLDKIAPR